MSFNPRKLSDASDFAKSEKPKTLSPRSLSFEKEDVSRFRSLMSAMPKGIINQYLDIAKGIRGLVGLEERPEATKTREFVEEHLKTRPEFAEKALERTGGLLAIPGGGGFGTIVRAGLGGLGGQAVEEAGGGPIAQTAAEIIPFGIPKFGRKIIPSSKEQKAVLDLGRKYGLSEKQLAPLMPENAKRKVFGKIATKGETTTEALKETKRGISDIYKALQQYPGTQNVLPMQDFHHFAQEMNKIGMSMPHALRTQLKHDAADLLNAAQKRGGITGDELMNFFHDISSRYNLGKETLQRFKGPVMEALKKISPEAGADFEIANKMYARYAKMAKTLAPAEYEGLLDLGKSYATAAAVAAGDVSTIGKIMGYATMRKFAKAMVTNPRLQNINKQIEEAIKKHNVPMIGKLGNLLLYEAEKYREKED